jgi:DNA-binding NarL/FixJ family response regulator
VTSLRVVICDDHVVLRVGLRLILERQPGYTLVGEAADGPAVIALAKSAQPDLVILDLNLPGGSGLTLIEPIRQAAPQAKVVILTVHEDEAFFFAALQAGAAGYVLKGGEMSELLAALDLVAQGGIPIPRQLGQRLAAEHLGQATDLTRLTGREVEILRLVAAGRSNREIGEQLALSVRTVERHRSAIMSKLGFHNKVELLRYAIRHGWVDPASAE